MLHICKIGHFVYNILINTSTDSNYYWFNLDNSNRSILINPLDNAKLIW